MHHTKFVRIARLRANVLKSNIYNAGVSGCIKEEILRITGFQEGYLPARYLGIPLVPGKLRTADYSPLVDSILAKISSWPRNTLSHAGKLELIRSVLQGVECFWLSILPIPMNMIDRIYKICHAFMWTTKHPPITWDMLCKPKEMGGLGLKDLKGWNKALLGKVLWNIHQKKDTLWIKWVNQIYLNSGNVWDKNEKNYDSPLLEKILLSRNEFVNFAGSIQGGIQMMNNIYGDTQAMSKAYNFFVPIVGRWPWKPLIWKACILPKHRLYFVALCAWETDDER